MDKLAARKVAGVQEAIRGVGASLLYLPPYSPDLNPIEQLFAKLKALLRKTAAGAKEALWSAIGGILDTIPESKCRNDLRNCGYEFTQVELALIAQNDAKNATAMHGKIDETPAVKREADRPRPWTRHDLNCIGRT